MGMLVGMDLSMILMMVELHGIIIISGKTLIIFILTHNLPISDMPLPRKGVYFIHKIPGIYGLYLLQPI